MTDSAKNTEDNDDDDFAEALIGDIIEENQRLRKELQDKEKHYAVIEQSIQKAGELYDRELQSLRDQLAAKEKECNNQFNHLAKKFGEIKELKEALKDAAVYVEELKVWHTAEAGHRTSIKELEAFVDKARKLIKHV